VPSIELKKTTGFDDYCEKQLSGIYDEINETDDNTYTSLQQEAVKASKPESSYAKLTSGAGALTKNTHESDGGRGAIEYLQLVNDQYVEVLPDDDFPEYLKLADYS